VCSLIDKNPSVVSLSPDFQIKKARRLIRRRAWVDNMIYLKGSHVAHHRTPIAPPPETKKQICADILAVCPGDKVGIG
jgi:hypothetical protein